MGLNLACGFATWKTWPPAQDAPYLEQDFQWHGYVDYLEDGSIVAVAGYVNAATPTGAVGRMLRCAPLYGILLCYPIIHSLLVTAVAMGLAVRRRPLRFFIYGGAIGAGLECVAIAYANLLGWIRVTLLPLVPVGSFPLAPAGWYPLSLPLNRFLLLYFFPLNTLADPAVCASVMLFLGMALSGALCGGIGLIIERGWRRRVSSDQPLSEIPLKTPAPGRCWPRFRVRGLMVLVAVVAVAIVAARGAVTLTPKVRQYRSRAQGHGSEAKMWHGYARAAELGWVVIDQSTQSLDFDDHGGNVPAGGHPPSRRAAVEGSRRRAALAKACRSQASFHEEMRQKWLRSAFRPWEDVPPDPPPPLRLRPSERMGRSL
jgi:hypothetical protein